jgi:hypothetical protein
VCSGDWTEWVLQNRRRSQGFCDSHPLPATRAASGVQNPCPKSTSHKFRSRRVVRGRLPGRRCGQRRIRPAAQLAIGVARPRLGDRDDGPWPTGLTAVPGQPSATRHRNHRNHKNSRRSRFCGFCGAWPGSQMSGDRLAMTESGMAARAAFPARAGCHVIQREWLQPFPAKPTSTCRGFWPPGAFHGPQVSRCHGLVWTPRMGALGPGRVLDSRQARSEV